MLIWIVGVLLLALAGVIGYFLGAIRSAICLAGLVVSAALAKTVGAWCAGLIPLIGFTNPVWQFYLPPLVGFLLLSLVFLGVALGVDYWVQKRYRNSTDEYSYARWLRLNRRMGTAVGAGVGTVWLVLLGMVAYVPGYLSTQLANEDEGTMSLRFANQFARGMEQSGLSRIVERFQPADEAHYLASDILGMVYHNPSVHSRLASYPPFLGMAERQEVADLGRDPEIQTLLQSRAGLMEILEHPRIRAVADNHEIVNELLELDLRDLEAYLRTGVSDRFKDERILGRWRLNVRRSIAEMRNVGSERLPAVEFNLLRRALNVYLDEMVLGFTTDHRALLKVKAKDEHKLLEVVGRAGSASAPTSATPVDGEYAPSAPGSGSGMTARSLAARALPQAQPTESTADLYRDRYGLGGGGGGGGGGVQQRGVPLATTTPRMAPGRPPSRPSSSSILAPMMTTGDGEWSRAGDDYRIRISQGGNSLDLQATIRDRQMMTSVDGRILVFDRL
ncbi:MAG: CvpA family protein [Verrucomicrobiae bacterium]|nr:CvpA family protein [Verrucomicrobiae bacterium]